jgi:hypothetical protein
MRGQPTATFGRWRPWLALAPPPVSWMTFEYGLGSALRGHCAAVGSWLGPTWGALSLGICAVAVIIALPLARAASASAPPARPWLARVALFEAGVFMLAIAFQTIATLIVPSCAR